MECTLTTEAGGAFLGVAPSGASTGIFEALELRDGGAAFHGKGVSKAVANVNDVLAPALLGKSVLDQRALDTLMVEVLDGSKNEHGWTKSKLGANAILCVSMAICRAGAVAAGLPLYAYIASLAGRKAEDACVLPVPSLNCINGGEHSGAPIVFQEFMLLPVGASSFAEGASRRERTHENACARTPPCKHARVSARRVHACSASMHSSRNTGLLLVLRYAALTSPSALFSRSASPPRAHPLALLFSLALPPVNAAAQPCAWARRRSTTCAR